MPGAVSSSSAPPAGAYTEHTPHAALAPHVECFWSRTSPPEAVSSPRTHRVLPDGCVDIVVAFRARCAAPEMALAVGTMTRPLVFDDGPDTTYIGVRFRPGVGALVLGVPASELTDQRVALADLWPETDELSASLGATVETSRRIRTLSSAIAQRLLAAPGGPPRVVVAGVDHIIAAGGDLSIGDMAATFGVTRQHLARVFAAHVGLSPKMLARVVRARRVVDCVRRGGEIDWGTVAVQAGYYDQSHLIADLKELTGLSPMAWIAARA